MALAAGTIWEVQTGGSDTLNGGAFDPTQTAGMFTDLAATVATTASPVVTSASYAFVAGDVGAWLFIGAGTNWTKGWYLIASVAGGAATLSAAIGSAVQSSGATTSPIVPSTVIGCATVASPTGATWSIDYSQQSAAAFAYTDLASAGTGLTVSSAAQPFGRQQVGNCLVITGGTNFNTGRYVIASVAAVTFIATVIGAGNITTGAGVTGTGGLGGALASCGQVSAHIVTSNQAFIATGSYSVTSASNNVAAGCVGATGTAQSWEGYDTIRGDLIPLSATGTRPTLTASGISTFTLFTPGTFSTVRNLILDGGALTSARGTFVASGLISNVHAKNFTNSAFGTTSTCIRCSATGCSAVAPFSNTQLSIHCVAYSNTITAFVASGIRCIAYNNSGASSDGFTSSSTIVSLVNCVAYGNGRAGFVHNGIGAIVNCIAEGNGSVGYNLSSSNISGLVFYGNAAYNNTGGAIMVGDTHANRAQDVIAGSASFFTDAASGDFTLNTTAGGGVLLRATGYPGVFPAGLTTGYVDIGAAQHADPAAGGVNRALLPAGVSALG